MTMNKFTATKQYATVMLCITLLSCLLLLITPFLNVFQMELGMLEGSETGMDYMTNLLEGLGEEDEDDRSSEKSSSSSGYYSGSQSSSKKSSSRVDSMLLEDGLGRWILRALVVAAWAVALLFGIKTATSFSKSRKDVLIREMLVGVTVCMAINAVYYLFCLFFVITENEWEIFDILLGDAVIKTATHVPFFLQILLFAMMLFLNKHWERAMAGKCAPLFGFLGGVKNETGGASAYTAAEPAVRQTQNEMDTLELLKKYKELLDAGVLTEAEFNTKKQELLAKTEAKARTAGAQGGKQADGQSESGQQEPELTRVCKQCGYPLYATQQVCPQCGASAVEKEKPKGPGMKWYNFLIYFLLFASAVVNTIMAIVHWSGAMYEGYADQVYSVFPELQLVDLANGIVAVILAIMALVTRSALKWNKRKGPILLCAMYIINGVSQVLYGVVASLIAKEVLLDGSMVFTCILSIVFAVINYIYFNKRKELFTY